MPFLADGGGGGGAAAPAGPVTMQVAPDQILALKARYEAVRDTVDDFIYNNTETLRQRAWADDGVSQETAHIFKKNADLAIDVMVRFLDELNLNIDQLEQVARTYNLAEDTNRESMQKQNRGI